MKRPEHPARVLMVTARILRDLEKIDPTMNATRARARPWGRRGWYCWR